MERIEEIKRFPKPYAGFKRKRQESKILERPKNSTPEFLVSLIAKSDDAAELRVIKPNLAITEMLSPLERKIIPYLNLNIKQIKEKTGLDEPSIFRALKFLENKNVLKIKTEKKRFIELGTNGIYYKKNNLPERNLLLTLEKNSPLEFNEASKQSKLTDNEFKVSIGILKNKKLIEIKNGKIFLNASKEDLTKKTSEESFLDQLPLEESSLNDDQKYAIQVLKTRKDIIEIKEKNEINLELSELGKSISGKEINLDLIEEVTPEIIKEWKKGKKFRKYDIHASVPRLYGAKRHFVSESISKGKRIWLDLGFKEMSGTKTQTSFWNFDALFTAQDHPVRELHDTFFIKEKKGKLPDKKIVEKVKTAHEKGVSNSKGWNYLWNEEEAKRVVLRTHTTSISAITLSKLNITKLPAKFFTIGKAFRNEAVDWSHGFEFNQSEGIVIDRNANLRNLIAYLKDFAEKMGFKKIRIQPAYFPYTEPSLEGAVWIEEKQKWIEVLAAGIFRPEVTIPLLGEAIPVLAWGPGFDRLMMLAQNLSDLREVYKNDLKILRERSIKTE